MLKGLETGVGKPGHDLASPVEEYVSSGLETWVGKPGHDVASPNRNKTYIYACLCVCSMYCVLGNGRFHNCMLSLLHDSLLILHLIFY